MRSVSSLTLVGLFQEIIVALGLPLNVAAIILGCIFSMLFSDFRAHGPISIPTSHIPALTEFFHADTKTNVHPLLVSWYFISSLRRYLCSCTYIMSMLWSIAEAVSSDSYPILVKVITLNVTICIVLLHFSKFALFELCNWFFEHWGQGSNLSRTRSFFTHAKSDAVWTWVEHVMENIRWLCFIHMYRIQYKR